MTDTERNERIAEIEKQLAELKATGHHQTCPHCGACQHCGRGGYTPLYPIYPYYPQPWWTQPVITYTPNDATTYTLPQPNNASGATVTIGSVWQQ